MHPAITATWSALRAALANPAVQAFVASYIGYKLGDSEIAGSQIVAPSGVGKQNAAERLRRHGVAAIALGELPDAPTLPDAIVAEAPWDPEARIHRDNSPSAVDALRRYREWRDQVEEIAEALAHRGITLLTPYQTGAYPANRTYIFQPENAQLDWVRYARNAIRSGRARSIDIKQGLEPILSSEAAHAN